MRARSEKISRISDGPVEKLDLPCPLEVALLDGRHGPVDQDKADVVGLQPGADLLDLALAEQRARMGARQAHDLGAKHFEPRQGDGQRHGFLKRRLRLAARGLGPDVGMQHEGAHGPRDGVIHAQSSPS